MDQADVALYAAKNAGKAQHVFFDPAPLGDPDATGTAAE